MLAAAGLLVVSALALSWAWTTLRLLPRTPQAAMSTGTLVLFPLTPASNFSLPRQNAQLGSERPVNLT